MVVASVGVTVLGRVLGRGRRQVEESRRLLRLPGVTRPDPPAGVSVGVDGIAPWRTPNEDFYLIHTALVPPAIEPKSWRLRIHGMVERELRPHLRRPDGAPVHRGVGHPQLRVQPGRRGPDRQRLVERRRAGGPVAEVGVLDGADAVLQTSADGWTCGTPLAALTDDRNAMLAVAMNGEPLSIDHGFPVRTLVPGLYGYVSACKWVVDWEVTTLRRHLGVLDREGLGRAGPGEDVVAHRRASRTATSWARSAIGGVAWSQHTGISGVEVSLDGGAWESAEIGDAAPSTAGCSGRPRWSGSRRPLLRVRATDSDGQVQTGVVADVLPDGATGWHERGFTAT